MPKMLIYLLRGLALFSAASLQWVVVASSQNKDKSKDDPNSAAQTPFAFTVTQSCADWVAFTWDSNSQGYPALFGPPVLSSCEITYMNQESQVAKLVMVVLHPDVRTLKLSRLNVTAHYAASMTCNETLTSNTVHFLTGYPCTSTEMKEYEAANPHHHQSAKNNTEVSRQPMDMVSANNDYSVTDMVLGLFFALCGGTVIACFGYYYWKKRRHRQRILRIFGQSHADPFLALHTPSDQPTSSF